MTEQLDRDGMLARVDSLRLPAEDVADVKRVIGYKRHDCRFTRVVLGFCREHELSMTWLIVGGGPRRLVRKPKEPAS